ncbi:MAG: S1C family serine protease [Alphaproteobacteria bacterium]
MANIFLKFLLFQSQVVLLSTFVIQVAIAEVTQDKITEYYDAIVSISSKVPSDARSAASLGTQREGNGVVIDNNLILTIGYIVTEASEIEIGLADGRSLPGILVGYDHTSGFGIIRPLLKTDLVSLKLGDSDKIQLDEPLFVMPAKRRGVGSVAKMVSRRPFSGWWEYYLDKPIFTLPANEDWGGTPLLNTDGEILGVGSLFVPDAASEGSFSPGNMFVPINLLKPILDDLIQYGRRQSDIKPYLGITSEDFAGSVVVRRVREGGPAFNAGLRPKDVITAVNGVPVSTLQKFYTVIHGSGSAGIKINLSVKRQNQPLEFTLKSIDRLDLLTKPKSF